ncbi:MAG TPA: MFS transporter [Bryobacteraceae bacterium]|nr:MFS transporter [Bryobacteraceae bacterium]
MPSDAACRVNEAAVYRKVTLRLMPYLFLCYILAYIDRVNVGFAKLQMQRDLGMTEAVYGLGAGIFFIGYFLFEIPANMILERVGARRWIGPIMIAWGILSAMTMWVQTAGAFYLLRFLLGLVESGFFPGVILYLTFWYTEKHRARMVALFMSAVPLAGVVAGPVSGWIMARMSGAGNLRAWQWLFLLEGLPACAAGIVALFYLTDNPAGAPWLTSAEREFLVSRLEEEKAAKARSSATHHSWTAALRSGKVWLFGLIYFGFVMGNYALGFWLPQLIADTLTGNAMAIGWLSVIPWGSGALAMIFFGRHSDKTGERRIHIALAGVVGAAAFAISAVPGISGAAGLAALTFATVGIMCAFSTFWALPTAILSGTAASAGIAWINSLGNLSGYVGPYAIGSIRDATHSMTAALLVISASALLASAATLWAAPSGVAHKHVHAAAGTSI